MVFTKCVTTFILIYYLCVELISVSVNRLGHKKESKRNNQKIKPFIRKDYRNILLFDYFLSYTYSSKIFIDYLLTFYPKFSQSIKPVKKRIKTLVIERVCDYYRINKNGGNLFLNPFFFLLDSYYMAINQK